MHIQRQALFWLVVLAVLGFTLTTLKDVLTPFVAASVIAYFLNPVADRLERYGLGRAVASALIVFSIAIAFVLAMSLIVPALAGQARSMALSLPENLDRLKNAIETGLKTHLGVDWPTIGGTVSRGLGDLAQGWSSALIAIAQSIWGHGQSLVRLVSLLLVTPLIVFYLLVDWHPMLERIDGWLPREHAAAIRRIAAEINAALSAFVRGQGLVCLALALFYAGTLSWAGVDYGAPIGLATGLMSFVPFIGWALGLIIAATFTILRHGSEIIPLLTVILIFAAGMGLDSALLSPRLVGQRIGLHPVSMLLAIYVFGWLFGLMGMIIAVPLAAALAVLIRFGLERYLASPYYAGISTAAVDPAPARTHPERLT